MSMQEMKLYLRYCQEGKRFIPKRKKMLDQKKKELCAEEERLQKAISYIDWKQNFYDEIMKGKLPYISNILPHKK
jgi:hypothetical protein